jgi:iron(III) transport system substrate-binding protein
MQIPAALAAPVLLLALAACQPAAPQAPAATDATTAGQDAAAPAEQAREVVVYASVDQQFAEPVLKDFEADTGIVVKALYDVEAAKTTGLVNRLIAEKDHPLADVWWSGEFAQTVDLAAKGVLAAYTAPNAGRIPAGYKDAGGLWTGFGGRARILIVNTDLVAADQMPKGLADLTASPIAGERIGIAYPLFGTAATQAAALYAARGPEAGKAFYQGLKDKGLQVVDGNGVVRDMVVAGQLAFGLTDTDDACGALAKGAPVKIVIPDQDGEGTLVVPNTVALVAGGPNPESGKALVDHLLSEAVERRLVEAGWIQLGLSGGLADRKCGLPGDVKGMDVSLEQIAAQMAPIKTDLAEIFVR